MVVIQSFTRPTTGIKHEERNVKAIINTRDVGKGTLYITESVLSWVDDNSEQGFSLQYLHIAVHAISRDLSSFPEECMYLMLDANIEQDEGSNDSDKSNASESRLTEIRFVPDNRSSLETMYSVMIECQELHPDPEDSSDSDEEIEVVETVVPEEFEDADEGPPSRPVSMVSMLRGSPDGPTPGPSNGFDHGRGMHGQRPGASNSIDDDDEPMDTDDGPSNRIVEGQFDDAD